jgi:branched-chain amino acid transport system ATP-binding protein
MSVLIELTDVTKNFGGLRAVDGVNLSVKRGEIFSVIGPNGSGKSTVFNLVTGVFPVTSGRITVLGRDIKGMRPHQVAALGVGRTFQTTRIFVEKSVLDNAMVGRHLHVRTGLPGAELRTRRFRDEEARHRARSLEILDAVGLAEFADRRAGEVPNALQQRIAIAMALASEPQVLMLDEPTGGLMEQEVIQLMHLLRAIRDRGVTIMLIEHKMRLVRQISDRIAVLNNGALICEGRAETVLNDPRVVEAYLGTEDASAA